MYLTLMTTDQEAGQSIGSVFPHFATHEIIKGLPSSLKIVDLSTKEAVYGLTGIYQMEIQNARLVANPGCYSIAALLPLVLLIRISSYLGTSGAARTPIETILYPEVSKGAVKVNAFSIDGQSRPMGCAG
ncbi:hypothetical protein QVD17_18087 [Tagetes erecta]|uniref:Uncharacterized protein n=1 Tax=Tagetes erecta TaxID=13708 RepID=A0AAD8KNG0_TARER|nr:hypothetical protein QVD17_18087 [Tagetes erecta]